MLWTKIFKPPGMDGRARLDDIVFSGGRLWCAASGGFIVSVDRNYLATEQRLNTHVRCLAFSPSDDVAWAGHLVMPGSADTRLRKSRNGGRSWEPVTSLPEDPKLGICGLAAIDDTTAFACGTYSTAFAPAIWRTLDGETWHELPLPRGAKNLIDLHFWNAREGMMAGGRFSEGQAPPVAPAIYLTSDGGENWQPATIDGSFSAGSYCWKLFFVDQRLGYASIANSGEHGLILKTTDGGASWSTISVRHEEVQHWKLQGIAFKNELEGWVAQRDGYVYETSNGGETWSRTPVLRDVNRFIAHEEGFVACGEAIYLGL